MINTLAVLFIPILLGYFLVKIKYLKADISLSIKQFVIRVAVPCRIFISMTELKLETIKQIFPLTLSFILLTISLIFISFLVLRIKDKKMKAAYIIAIAFGNYGYMGWAVLDGAMGPEGLSRGMFFTTLWWPVIYIGTFLIGKLLKVESKLDVKNFRLNMIIPSATLLIGILFNYLSIPIYEPLRHTITSLGDMTVTLILFSVGLTISFGDSFKYLKRSIVPVLLRPILGLITASIIINIIGLTDPLSRNTVLIESTMPAAVMTVVLGDMLGLDEKLTSAILILSTLLSLITIPLTLLFVGL
ncbi:MAG: AEC family transporter [Spirochaetaceae bacterium]